MKRAERDFATICTIASPATHVQRATTSAYHRGTATLCTVRRSSIHPSGETHRSSVRSPRSSLNFWCWGSATARGMRAMDTDTTSDTRQFGIALFDALFHDDLLDRLRGSLIHADAFERGCVSGYGFPTPKSCGTSLGSSSTTGNPTGSFVSSTLPRSSATSTLLSRSNL
jgi:hypothetical protein